MRFSKFLILFTLLAAILGAPPISLADNANGKILVSAAISLRDAFQEIAIRFKNETGAEAVFNLGASGVLQRQIENGAPADVFASAAERQMNELESKGFILKETRRDFAGNVLILISPADGKFHPSSLAGLESGKLNKIAVGNPKTAPVGQYTEEALTKIGILRKIQPKLVFAENVRQVLDYVERAEADAGVVYQSDVAPSAKVVKSAPVPTDLHSPIIYPIAVVRDSKNRELARKFIELVLSREGQEILHKYGFAPARPN